MAEAGKKSSEEKLADIMANLKMAERKVKSGGNPASSTTVAVTTSSTTKAVGGGGGGNPVTTANMVSSSASSTVPSSTANAAGVLAVDADAGASKKSGTEKLDDIMARLEMAQRKVQSGQNPTYTPLTSSTTSTTTRTTTAGDNDDPLAAARRSGSASSSSSATNGGSAVPRTASAGAMALDDVLKKLEDRAKEFESTKKKEIIPEEDQKMCEKCGAPLDQSFVTAGGKSYHATCFRCEGCKQRLGGTTFFLENEQMYCGDCYNEKFREKCARCGKACDSRFLSAMGKQWHSECFNCGECSKSLVNQTFLEKEGKMYCTDCYAERYSPRCSTCKKPIVGDAVVAKENKWHRECFKCATCDKQIGQDGYFIVDEVLYCKTCGIPEDAPKKDED